MPFIDTQAADAAIHAWSVRLARQCRHIIQACLREEEWGVADSECHLVAGGVDRAQGVGTGCAAAWLVLGVEWEGVPRGRGTEGDDLDDTSRLFAPAGETAHNDPPVHTRLRAAVQQEFRVKSVREKLAPVVRATVRALVEEIAGREEVVFVRQLALPLPGTLVCTWLDFDEQDHERLLGWFRAMAVRTPGQIELPPTAYAARDALRAHARETMHGRRSQPRADLLTVFAAAVGDGQLSEDEALGMTTQLFFAGITTTTALIGNALLHLGQHAHQRRRVQTAPEQIPAGVEELLRFEPPVQWLTRVTTRQVELHGTTLAAGARVLMLWAAANRDPAQFSDPENLDIARAPNRHLGFATGAHQCAGMALARLEGTVAISRFLARFPNYRLDGPPLRGGRVRFRGFLSVPCVIG